MSRHVIDSSVVLAVLREQADTLLLDGALLSTVNLAEVVAKVGELGITQDDMQSAMRLLARIEPFTMAQALKAGELRPLTRHAGLSLGDRACLALALELDADVYTADRAWASLDLPLAIHLIR